MIRHVELPKDKERLRELYLLMLHIEDQDRNLTLEELQDICIKRGYLKVE